MLDEVIKRRETMGQPGKRDLVQIIIDAHETEPEAFPEMRMRDELMLFMFVTPFST